MIPKAALKYLTSFIVIVAALIASDSLALQQSDRGRSERQSPEAAKRAEELFQIALLSSETGERENTRLRLQEAMRLWVQMREPGKAAKAALQIGDRYKHARKYQYALDYYQQALWVKSLPGPVRANALNAIALVYAELYQSNFAIRYFNDALDQARRIGDLPAQTLALTGLANLYYQQAAKEQALAYALRAQRLNQQKNADADPALLYLMGQILQGEGSLEKAKDAFEKALEIYKKTDDAAGQVRVLCAISNLSLLSSQKQAALEQAEEAVKLAETETKRLVNRADKMGARKLRWRALVSRARAERTLGNKQSAVNSYINAIGDIELLGWAVYIATEAGAIAFREETQAAYRELADLLMEQERFEEAYGWTERAKSRTILNLTAARRAMPPSDSSAQAAALREQYQSIVRMRLQMLASNISPEQQARLQKDIEEAELKLQEMRLRAEINNSRQRLVWSNLATAKQLKKQMAEDQITLAEFSLGENRSFIWLFTRGDIFCEILPGRKKIEEAIRSYLTLVATTPNPQYIEKELAELKKQAQSLFAILFGQLSLKIEPGQRLIVVPDGLLHYLPFESLIHNGRYLIEDHEISYSPSASMLGLWRDSENRIDIGYRMELLAVGDPIFEPKSKKGLSNWARQMLNARGFRLASLPKTREEVLSIADLFPPDQRKVLLGSESTEEAIKLESLRRYRRLHFATHSLIDEKSPSRSAVALTPVDQVEEDSFLEASEISRLELDCDLVVLSACQTGRGQLLSGEGIVGLSRAFFLAGARSVVVSLWNVSDISTAQLMKNFYQNLTGGLSNAAALRKAKLEMLNSSGQRRHPYYWSSFVMVGKP